MRVLIAVFVALLVGYNIARSAVLFPSVAMLEAALQLKAGMQLPKDVQSADGVIYHTYYDGARELSDGKYAIIVRLGR